MGEDSATQGDLFGPSRFRLGAGIGAKLISRSLSDPILADASQNHTIGGKVGAVRIGGINVNVLISGAGVVFAELQECGIAKRVCEFPVAPGPCFSMINGPGKLRVSGVSNPHIEDAIYH